MGNESEVRSGWQVSSVMTLNQLVEGSDDGVGGPTVRFHIPIYQRLYVWKKEQIERLLNDIFDAWQADNKNYYIGGTLVVEGRQGDQKSHVLELIDGQQRLTTLFLTALYRLRLDEQQNPDSESYRRLLDHSQDSSEDGIPRLHFEIRDKANLWLRTALRKGLEEAAKVGLGEEQAQEGDVDAAQKGAAGDDKRGDDGIAALERGVDVIQEWFRNKGESLSGAPDERPDFDTFLLNRVQMLVTSVPVSMDLSHLFETINDRSVQLEHHEVLKARMLKWLRKNGGGEADDGTTYTACARVWEACSAMDNYWEDALAEAASKNKTDVFTALDKECGWPSGTIGGSHLSRIALSGKKAIEFCRPSDTKDTAKAGDGKSLQELVKEGSPAACETPEDTGKQEHQGDEEKQSVESLISFPMLLLHTLRIWLHRHGPKGADIPRFDSLKLLDTFNDCLLNDDRRDDDSASHPIPDVGERVRSFIELLWEVRYLLDQHVIRWVELKEDSEWGHRILRLERNTSGKPSSLRRKNEENSEDNELSLLQSMLYHSQDTRQLLWLTPLLGYLHAQTFSSNGSQEKPDSKPDARGNDSDLTQYMRHLDNGLFSSASLNSKDAESASTDSGTLMQRSRAFLEQPWRSFRKPSTEPLYGGYRGTGDRPRTSHYWYYKIDFILWRQRLGGENSSGKLPDLGNQNDETINQLKQAWKEFRFTARTSVEHIHPQTPYDGENNREKWGEALDSFGNLALVSRERNSEFSNKPYHEKRGAYLTRLGHGDLQSPKLACVYLYGGVPGSSSPGREWEPKHANEHMEWVMKRLDDYFSWTATE